MANTQIKKIYLFFVATVVVLFSVTQLYATDNKAKLQDSLLRAKMGELFYSDDKEGFIQVCKQLVEYHSNSGDELLLFNAYATLFDRLHMWGRFDEALQTIETMSKDAQNRKSSIGEAITEFCFGQFYLGNRQPQEARIHYRKAFVMLQQLGQTGRAIRSGFNLQAIAMNLNDIDGGLAISDSTQILIELLEGKTGKRSVPDRMKQVRYRFVLLQRKGDLKEAGRLKDTLLYYAQLLNDPSQDDLILTSLAQYEQLSGNKKMAYNYLDTLIARNLRNGNYLKAAQYRLSLADFQKDNGDLAEAVQTYKAYAVETDSAHIHLTNEQLNSLTKKYELNELRLKNHAAKQNLTFALLVIALLLLLLVAIVIYSRSLRRKNRVLFEAAQKNIKAEEKAEKELVEIPKVEQSGEEKLYASLIRVVQKDELFKNPDLNRDQLCSILGTNRTYLANAVKQCGNMTLSGFINYYRLRWAAEALANNQNLSVMAVGEDAGFSSRATFNRLFQNKYGMSPSAYRIAANSSVLRK